jgi:hypothetical protein
VVYSSELLTDYPEDLGSNPPATKFSVEKWVWNGVHSAFVRINEELLERKVGDLM